MIPYPAAMDRSAARMDDIYAQISATPSMREAFLPSLVIDGAINPITIRGTQKLISSDNTESDSYDNIHHCVADSPGRFESCELSCDDSDHYSYKQFKRKTGEYFFHLKSSLFLSLS